MNGVTWTPARIVLAAIAVITGFTLLFAAGSIMENVDAKEIVIIQDPIDGDLHVHITAGLKPQMFGRVTRYPKRMIYSFENRIRFNDGGHGTMHGSIQAELPLDRDNMIALHEKFGSAEAIQNQLLQVVTDKSVYMTGPLLSSKESYAEKRSNMITWVEDQIANGIYSTTQRNERTTDPLTGEETTITVVEIVLGEGGIPQRSELPQLTSFGIRPFNFSVTAIPYDQEIEEQIKTQQQNIMAVQTSIAEARQAEQRAITIEQQGMANAAEAKWKQEVEKAQAVTLAQQTLEVARLNREAAAEERQRNILLGQGEAERKRLVMNADGALQQRLDAYVRVSEMYADAIKSYAGAWVPTVVMGGEGGSGAPGSGATQLIEMLMAKTAQDLAVQVNAPRGRQP